MSVRDARIHRFAAVWGDTAQSLVFPFAKKCPLPEALTRLDDFAETAQFLLGHNIVAFDVPHLAAAMPRMQLLGKPLVDTLRLNPLAFPRNPYHHLVKHYQDGQLKRGRINDPELDARLTLEVFRDQRKAFVNLAERSPDLALAWHWLVTLEPKPSALDLLFSTIRRQGRPTDAEAKQAIVRLLQGQACQTHTQAILADLSRGGWPLAYALAWLSVAGGNSVMPPWVRHQFPEAGHIVRRLRDVACDAPDCQWCTERHNPRRELHRWFGFDAFRPEPRDKDGRSLQENIVHAAMSGGHVLGILPTGTGKSLCYQIPALSRYDKIGALTIVISPLVALMADQVAGLEARNITCCAAINGLLSMPERSDILDRVRLGDIGILIVSPEQLRNRTVRRVIGQREIGAWVLDEAHCISKWGQDFRPDYRYVGRFIKEKAGDDPVPPVLCLTATAKPDVIEDIVGHFRAKVGIELKVFDGGAKRNNLDFDVIPTTTAEKFAHAHQVLMSTLPPDMPGGAIVYCSTRAKTEEMAEFLTAKGLAAGFFHAGMAPESKKSVQQRFVGGELRVIAATNAFGMGIDKPDVRLVIHADIPGSLENYLQEAGRAGRDREAARCVLLYTQEDVEWQFGMSARSRLSQSEIQVILKSLRNLDRKKKLGGELIATPAEILAEDTEGVFERDSATDDTRVRTALSWLEEAKLLSREENSVQVFPSSLRVASVEEAETKLAAMSMAPDYRRQLLSLVRALVVADPDDGISTDELMGVSRLSAEKVRTALYDLERLGIASNDTALTAFVHVAVERSSMQRLEEADALETALIQELRFAAPEMDKGESSVLHLRHAAQRLKDDGCTNVLPEKLWRIIRSLASDGRTEGSGAGSLRLRRLDAESVEIRLGRGWDAIVKTAQMRRTAAQLLLGHLSGCLPTGARGTDLLAETTLGKLLAAMQGDLLLKAETKDPQKLCDRALLWLHEQEVIRLNKGLAVFRPAMTIRLDADRRSFVKADFTPLKLHYDEQVVQIHVMAEYAQRGLKAMVEALQLTMDYFSLGRDTFLHRWLPSSDKELARQTTPDSWRTIVERLDNPIQQRIVADDREMTNVLVLAGPGAGKTRVLVHRIAYLVRVKRENPYGIIALAYNRHAAVEIRKRLAQLIGDDAKGVTVLTCHGLAMRLAGASFAQRGDRVGSEEFRKIIEDAVALLKGEGLPPEEADEQRDRLLAGFRWVLVDEYQDIGPEQYRLISALSGRTLRDDDSRLSLFAVGDDDQNVYAFNGASVEFIRCFEADYRAKPAFLTENYRSTSHIIDAANLVIEPAASRMKAKYPITVDRARRKLPLGGDWQAKDQVSQGRVQVIPASNDMAVQAIVVMSEFRRLAALDDQWDWSKCAVIAREWKFLDPLRTYCELNAIPVQLADEDTAPVWQLRETRALVFWLRKTKLVTPTAMTEWIRARPEGPWWTLLHDAVDAYSLETGGAELPSGHFIEWLAEWGRDVRRRQTGLLLLTAHRSKGLEFDHVAVLDGGWEKTGKNEDRDSARRLFYVAMTRARKTLMLARFDAGHVLIDTLPKKPCLLRRERAHLAEPAPEMARRYQRLTLEDVDIGFSGRQPEGANIHATICRLQPGAPLRAYETNGRWMLADPKGLIVGRLARSFSPPSGMACIEARVVAIVERRRSDTDEKYLDRLQCEQWEVILPELTFAPVGP
ncbi:RecQ family ATP-dependent DNA helicase [Telmatospirillum siberiense]|uniref:RecQ family ATP-dependent DNA helicase n=1 Tax=Telmatospirillum siberiense TaxID=382514 RepID=UPI0018EAB73D|nr:RecQ family ATP-dependent DNA helicase [Telmatospirillum siberiense]